MKTIRKLLTLIVMLLLLAGGSFAQSAHSGVRKSGKRYGNYKHHKKVYPARRTLGLPAPPPPPGKLPAAPAKLPPPPKLPPLPHR